MPSRVAGRVQGDLLRRSGGDSFASETIGGRRLVRAVDEQVDEDTCEELVSVYEEVEGE